MQFFLTHLEKELQGRIISTEPIGGGDISKTLKLLLYDGTNYLAKFNNFEHGFDMLQTEAKGLKTLGSTNCIRVPEVHNVGVCQHVNYLVIEFISTSRPSQRFWSNFALSLGQLHRQTNHAFGFAHDNFIGSLPQRNTKTKNWPTFYQQCRITPQITMAHEADLLSADHMQKFEKLLQLSEQLFPAEPPALVHGDLWSGNFLVADDDPVLIDPSIHFGHREMDLAMTKLFGGFDDRFYQVYESSFPLERDFETRIDLYQLYYLLVHLNLFGRSYLSSILNVLNKYVR